MKTFLSCLAVAVILFAAVGYWQGWISIESSANKATIEVETKEIKQAANNAIDKSKSAIEKAGEALEKTGGKQSPQATGEADNPSLN